jgi:GT2 family glycosyltransferase
MVNSALPFISVIIPNYNDALTLRECLESVLGSDHPRFEVIVVDDRSTDNSIEIISAYPVRLVQQSANQGAAAARNAGVRAAQGDIYFFVDADVIIYKDTLTKLADLFSLRPDAAAIVGIYDEACAFPELTSIHFNSRIRFEYLKMPESINVFYSAIGAVKKEAFNHIGGFNPAIKGVEDTDLGLRLVDYGYRIYLAKTLISTHKKKISFLGLLRNDYSRTADRVKLLFGRRMLHSIVKKKVFISTGLLQLFNPFFAVLFWGSLLLVLWHHFILIISFISLCGFAAINYSYLVFMHKRGGAIIVIKLYLLLLCDMFIVAGGLMGGGISVLQGKKYT